MSSSSQGTNSDASELVLPDTAWTALNCSSILKVEGASGIAKRPCPRHSSPLDLSTCGARRRSYTRGSEVGDRYRCRYRPSLKP